MTMKPRIRLEGGVWMCMGKGRFMGSWYEGRIGLGSSPAQAYENWRGINHDN